jgi:adenylosuccinate lyase
MMSIFSARERASTWRQLWVWLAEAEKELGLPIPDEALDQMRANVVVSDKAFSVARDYEAKFRVCYSSLAHSLAEKQRNVLTLLTA